ncbi:MarR family winged helix-turn-helix transcriptional regulator [Flavobacterium sp. W21_SRS_FM6]|uniref:MarR family winged helix-turn-helix transcriptional regulator n=1 Tax=Flavobacterium sp. W21_SRS_FM6 TaxID=3240268 RepID=UPI003F921128
MPSHFRNILALIEKNLIPAYQQFDLTENQFQILNALPSSEMSDRGGVGQKLLVQVTGFPKHQITRELAKLETRGLLRRTVDQQSRRCKNIILTKEGSNLAGDISLIYNNVLRDVFSVLSDEECSTLQKLLLKVY